MIARRSSCLVSMAAAIAALVACSASVTAQYVDTNSSCILCHQAMPLASDFCSSMPAAVWLRDDKHKRAFYLLHETDPADPGKGAAKRELVRRILGFELREAFLDDRYLRLKDDADPETARKVSTVKSCLRCHATWPKAADERYARTPPVALDLGVSCQACHGPGEKWDLPHRFVAWRAVTPAAKAALGFADCRSSAAKAELCASCHVGNVAEDKLVKHEWYAAGHPPLPSFELATFEAQMPGHWKSLREKGPFAFRDAAPRDDSGTLAGQMETLQRVGIPADAIKSSYLEANFPRAEASGVDPFSDLANSKDAIVGGAAVSKSYVRVVGDYAALAADNKAPWPELALYDCTACHHELRSGLGVNSRPRRSHAPGRPPLATWPAGLLPLAVLQTASDDADFHSRLAVLQGQFLQLDRALTDRPFGEPAAIRAAAESLGAALDELTSDAANTAFDDAAARRAVRWLTDPAQYETNDFYTARQAAWAIRAIASDLGAADAKSLFLRGDDDPLALALPSGPDRSVIENLGRWLPAAAHYDPTWFREELKAARAKLAP